MLYTFTVVVNLIALAVAVWLGIYIVTRSPRSQIAWLAGLALWSIAGYFLNTMLALNPPPSPALMPLWVRPLLWFWPVGAFEGDWSGWLQGWQITPAVMIWHHVTLLIRTGQMNPWRWARVAIGYFFAIAAIIGQRYPGLVYITTSGDPLYLSALVPGPLYPLYMFGLLVFTCLSLINLIRSARAAPSVVQRKQLNLMVAATVIAGLAGPISFISYQLDFLMPRVFVTLLLGSAVFMIGYGVARYSALIEGRVIGRDFIYNGLVILLTATVYLFVVWSSVVIYGVPVIAVAIVVILAVLSHSLVDVGRRLFDFLFYNRETRELRAQLRHLAQRAYKAESLVENLSSALETLCRFVHATYGVIILFKDGDLQLAASYGWRHAMPDLQRKDLASDDVVHLRSPRFASPLEEATLLIPLYAGEIQQGVLIMGPPENALTYAKSDVERLLEAGDRIADLIRDAHRESEHLAQLTQIVQTSPPKLNLESEIPTRAVEEALRNLYDYAHLSDSTLAKLKRVQAASSNLSITHLDRGKLVYQTILEALEKLRPPGEVPREPIPRQWYPYLILYYAYLENKPNNEIMSHLYISEGTFNRTRRAAIRSLARVLSEMEVAIP
ncbi:MAG TPA: hypothetical protein VJ821_07075 [Anaerolineales bacterium]|nr:hypothetical protein [Anaerolineales bacterium]